jgi:hypothetical protein
VLLWPDCFNNFFFPETAQAAVEVLEAAGFQVVIPPRYLCCGRPLYDFGWLNPARGLLRQILDTLRPEIEAGTKVVGLEPSCVAVFRDEMVNLFPNDQDARRLKEQTFLLSEFLEQHVEGYQPPKLARKAVVHGHCLHKAVLDIHAEDALLGKIGLEHQMLDSGCCGMAGSFGFEAGQSAVGDIFAWFAEHGVPPEYHEAAARQGTDVHGVLEAEASRLRPGQSGLLALDWWNGNRSVLVDADLTGLMLGYTLQTEAHEIYRALIEATAYGTRTIIDNFNAHGIPVTELYASGGLPERNRLLMQIYADVTGLPIHVSASGQTPALGSAMFGALAAGTAAGGYDTIGEAALHMAHLKPEVFQPIPEHTAVYEQLYREYTQLHDYFGRGANDVMKRLKELKAHA